MQQKHWHFTDQSWLKPICNLSNLGCHPRAAYLPDAMHALLEPKSTPKFFRNYLDRYQFEDEAFADWVREIEMRE